MSFFDDLRKNLEAVSKASESVVKRSGSAVELRKLKMEQDSLKKELNNCYAQIGRLVVEKMEGTDIPAEMEMLIAQIADCKEAIAENEQLIAKKTGQKVCPVCGTKAGKAAVFCQKCGTRLPDYEPERDEEYAEEEPVAEEAEEESAAEKAEEVTEPEDDAKTETAIPEPEEKYKTEDVKDEAEDTPI